MPVIWFLIVLFLANLGQPQVGLAAPAPEGNLEQLQYRVSLGVLSDIARVHLSLTQVGPNRYRASFGGAAQGMWKLLSRWLPEGYESEMALEHGRLKPLVYREEFEFKGHQVRKEYRFDYSRGLVEIWRGQDHQEPVKSRQVPLQEPMYDPLSLFYNIRLGALGPLAAGETLKVATISDPEPLQMTLSIGPETPEGRKIMLEESSEDGKTRYGPYFLFCTPKWVPRLAWMRVPLFGKLSGELLNPEEIMKEGRLNSPSPAAAGGKEP